MPREIFPVEGIQAPDPDGLKKGSCPLVFKDLSKGVTSWKVDMIYLYLLVLLAFLASLFADPGKTFRALKIGAQELLRIAPALLLMVILVTFFLLFFPEEKIAHYLGGKNPWGAFSLALLFGSVTIMPGFIAFPLCGILLKAGVSYMVLSAFANALMLVGIATFPLEREYFGTRVALLRNGLGLAIAMVVALVTGFFYGELF